MSLNSRVGVALSLVLCSGALNSCISLYMTKF